MVRSRLETRRWDTVEVDYRQAVGVAVLGIGEVAAVGEGHAMHLGGVAFDG